MNYKQSIIKQSVEYILIMPIVTLGRLFGTLIRPPKIYTHFLFFPSADIGGSVKVNAEITECIKDKKTLIIFSKTPRNNKFKDLFVMEGVDILDLSKWVDNKAIHFINVFFRGFIASWINRAQKSVVFGGECLYFYKIIPHLSNKSRIIELCHLNTWIDYTQAFIKKIDKRIFSTQKIMRDHELQYTRNNIERKFHDRLFFIDNKIEIPAYHYTQNEKLEVLYVGRGAPQKRVHLMIKIALMAAENNIPVHFSFVGDVDHFFDTHSRSICKVYGEIRDRNELESIYQKSDALILTSAYEGLPLVVMDMMARGKIIISTAVDSIPDYIEDNITGMLIENKDEEYIISKGVMILKHLSQHPEITKKISLNAYKFACSHFSKEKFDSFYKEILK